MAIDFLSPAQFDDRIEIVDNHGGSARNITLKTTSTKFEMTDELLGEGFFQYTVVNNGELTYKFGDYNGYLNQCYIEVDDANDYINLYAGDIDVHGALSADSLYTSGNATIAGGSIQLYGTGRILGIDTVSANTDAANKLYVDNAVSGVSVGVTSISEGSGIKVTNGSSANPTVSVNYDSGDTDNLIFAASTVTSVSGAASGYAAFMLVAESNPGLATGSPTKIRLSDVHLEDFGAAEGNINLGSNKITSLATPTASTDAANKSYVDTAVSSAGSGTFLPLAGGTMTGDILMDGKTGAGNVIGLATGTSSDAMSLKLYTYNNTDPGGGLGTSTGNMIQADLGSNLVLRQTANDGDITLQSDNGSGGIATYILADGSTGAVNLYNYGNKKLETTSGGATVTGNLTASGKLLVQSAGTASSPAVYFTARSTTGMYFDYISNSVLFSSNGSQRIQINSTGLTISNISAATSDTDKFLVSDSGLIKYRTGTQVRSDIGAGTVTGATAATSDYLDGINVSASTTTPVVGLDIDGLTELSSIDNRSFDDIYALCLEDDQGDGNVKIPMAGMLRQNTVLLSNFYDSNSTSSTYYFFPFNTLSETSSNQYYNSIPCFTSGRVARIMMMNMPSANMTSGTWTTQIRVSKNGSTANTSTELTPTSYAIGGRIEYNPYTSFSKGDRLQISFQKSQTNVFWNSVSCVVVLQFGII